MLSKVIFFEKKRKKAKNMTLNYYSSLLEQISIPKDNPAPSGKSFGYLDHYVTESNSSIDYSDVNPYTEADVKAAAQELNQFLAALKKEVD